MQIAAENDVTSIITCLIKFCRHIYLYTEVQYHSPRWQNLYCGPSSSVPSLQIYSIMSPGRILAGSLSWNVILPFTISAGESHWLTATVNVHSTGCACVCVCRWQWMHKNRASPLHACMTHACVDLYSMAGVSKYVPCTWTGALFRVNTWSRRRGKAPGNVTINWNPLWQTEYTYLISGVLNYIPCTWTGFWYCSLQSQCMAPGYVINWNPEW